jgi:hypothetical protein
MQGFRQSCQQSPYHQPLDNLVQEVQEITPHWGWTRRRAGEPRAEPNLLGATPSRDLLAPCQGGEGRNIRCRTIVEGTKEAAPSRKLHDQIIPLRKEQRPHLAGPAVVSGEQRRHGWGLTRVKKIGRFFQKLPKFDRIGRV